MSPRHSSATQHELARVGLLAHLPGELLGRLAASMERETLAPGASPEPGAGPRLYVVLAGMLRGADGRVLRPGDDFGDPGARAMTAATVASCERDVYEGLAPGS